MERLTLLSKDQIFGRKRLEIIKELGTMARTTDFAILLDNYISNNYMENNSSLDGQTGCYWTKTVEENNKLVNFVSFYGDLEKMPTYFRGCGIRPVIVGYNNKINAKEIELGEYPQTVASTDEVKFLSKRREDIFNCNTGKYYIVDSRKSYEYDKKFFPLCLPEYEIGHQKYVLLSNGKMFDNANFTFIKVKPIKWLVDQKTSLLIAKNILLAGVKFDSNEYTSSDFTKTAMFSFLNNFLLSNINSSDNIYFPSDRIDFQRVKVIR